MRKQTSINILKYFILFMICLSCSDNLPYNLEKFTQNGYTSISDSTGMPIIEESYSIAFNDKNPKIMYIEKYSTNSLGLVVYIETTGKKFYYVAIKPKPKEEQNYAELQVNYTIYKEQEYKKLCLDDNWNKIR